ncbi:MAG TPA: glycine betaine ABC transporter substrate-binding protein [Solirubrobacteraceae bacterium]|jgi:osmoprotectant transport system substrate-binding protein|nr:glycine betaine ABC transporter substrate-binding protein [Solirubrobacteraceae bacterium]
MRFNKWGLTRLAAAAAVAAGLVGSATLASSAAAKSLPGTGKPTFVLGDKNFPEEYVLGSLYQEALEAKGYKVKLIGNLGSTEIAWKSLKSGQIQGYPEYDGTLLSTVAGITKNPANSKAAATETKNWLAKHGYDFTNVTPFTDSDAIAVLKSYANAHGLKTIGDLKKLGAAVKLGGAAEFSTRYPDGLVGLNKIYDVHPTFDPLTISDFYDALDDNQVNAAVVFTTDPPLKTGKYVVLKDTKFIFGFQNVGLVVKKSVATAEGPAFTSTVNAVSKLLTQQAIIALNSDVEVDKQSPATVAKAFLKVNHLL